MHVRTVSCRTVVQTLCLAVALCCACGKREQPTAPGPSHSAEPSSKRSQSEPASAPTPGAKPSDFQIADVSGKDLSNFDHYSSRHKTLTCKACHERRDNSTTPRRPGHGPC